MTTLSLFCGGGSGGGRIGGKEGLAAARGGERRSLVSEKNSRKG
jgi:hypothetical protein